MDDFVLWADEKKDLLEWNARMGEFLEDELRLECKPAQINWVERGMPFLGSRLFPITYFWIAVGAGGLSKVSKSEAYFVLQYSLFIIR